jgi:unsaturated rhamnogalacturonyl hydrolase
MKWHLILALFIGALWQSPALAQPAGQPNMPPTLELHTLRPDYTIPYGAPTPASIVESLNRIHGYLDTATPTRLVNRKTGEVVTDFAKINEDVSLDRGAFNLVSYEWGVTYGAMLLASEVTGDRRFADYTARRLKLIADLAPIYRNLSATNPRAAGPLRSVLVPRALDDAGSMCAAMIKALRAGIQADLRPLIGNYIQYISAGQQRLDDGTLARNRPLPNTLWLDDLYMSVPALAQMGTLTGETRYYDDAVRQITQFSERMFNTEKGLYMHGWVSGMNPHPEFHWARANGWAILTMVETLEVLPENHPGRAVVLDQLRKHARGLVAYQTGTGFWHQLIDRSDSYLETSATAIYAYCLAHAINRGWLDPQAFGPAAVLAWNAVSTQINSLGQVEKVCVGTGMAFDPAFYYFRPTNVFAAHGYGPTLLAGAEMLTLLKAYDIQINDSAVMVSPKR